MERLENLLSFINELNENGKIQYEDYAHLFDLACEFDCIEETCDAVKADIAAILWLNGNCEYCGHGEQEEFSGASRWRCNLGNASCRPVWRGTTVQAKNIQKAAPVEAPTRAPKSRAERLFGPKETWGVPHESKSDIETIGYKGFLLVRCSKCGTLRGFCAKQPITSYRCECGGETPLRELTSVHVNCKCGKHFKYRTNVDDDSFAYNCLECGAPVDLSYNKKSGAYQTVR